MKKNSFPFLLLILGLCLLKLADVSPPAASAHSDKISSRVLAATAGGEQADFLVVLGEQADLSAAYTLPTKRARGRFVRDALWETAQRSQAPLRAWLDAQGVPYRSFYIVNLLHVQAGDRALVEALAARPDVARIEANPRIYSVQPQPEAHASPLAPQDIEWNIRQVNADQVWNLSYRGQGIVIGGQDTGYDWDHPALINQYRGWDGDSADHDYNWHDAIHSGGGSCGADSPVPCDDHSHGTHTMGILVGDDGEDNQIGVAPGARWIGCRNMNQGVGSPVTYLECFEFFLAPYPVGGDPSQGNPDLAPDVTNNSWSCPTSEGCSWDTLQDAVEAQRAAGIMTVVSAGNEGSSCSSVAEPPGLYDASYTVGSTDSGDNIASSSSRGPVTIDGSNRLKPDISAPGVTIRSSVPGTGYGYKSGTSMAAPHVAGAAALLWSARPGLRGQITQTEEILNTTAVPRYSTQCGDPANTVPNNVYGWGRLDALAAVRQALDLSLSPNPVVSEMMAQVQASTVYTYVGDLSGEWPVIISGEPYTIQTRYSYSGAPISQATQYAYEHFQDLGLDTTFHEYTWSGNDWRNVIAEQPGSEEPERIFLITAHVDDLPPDSTAPGADDNASGSTGVLVAADILSQYDLSCTLRYVLFSGEEQGLRGSTAYAEDAHAGGENIEGVLNLDMIGYNSDSEPILDLYARSNVTGSLDIAQTFWQVVTAYDLDLTPHILVDNWLGNYSDNRSFWDQGYPAILAIEDFDDFTPYYHSTDDRLATLDITYLTHFVRAAVGTFAHMSCLPDLGYINGTVSDDQLVGLSNATLQAITGTVTYTATTDASGHYTLSVYPDTYAVSAWKYGYAPKTITGVVVPNHTAIQADLSLSQTVSYSLTGCITDSVTGDPLAATVAIRGPFGALLTETHTLQPSGCYTLTLYGGPYTLTAQARLHQPASVLVNLVTDAVQNLSLVPTTTDGLLWGYVTGLETGQPVAGATIQVSPGLTQTQSGTGGYYEVQLPPAPYAVTISAFLYTTVTETGVIVPQHNLVQRNYALPASRIVLFPSQGISVTLSSGAQVTRSLTISNGGSGELTFNISNDEVPWSSASPVSGALDPETTLPLTLTFDAAVAGNGFYTGSLRFYTNDPQAQPHVDYALTMTVPPPPPAFVLDKTTPSDRVETGTLLFFTITATNSGGPATGVTISDMLPANTLFASASHGGGLAGNDVVWSGLSVPASSTLAVNYAVTVTCIPSGTPIVNSAYQVTASEWPTPTRGQALTVTAKTEGIVVGMSFPTPVVRYYPVRFTNLSQNATSYVWAFGDGHTSRAVHPSHTFMELGPHTVVLTASNFCRSKTYSQTLTVHDYALTLLPAAAAGEAKPGQHVTYTLQLTNTGAHSDTYDLSRRDGQWPVILLPSETFSLTAGARQEITVRITIPPTVTVSEQDVSTVLITTGSRISATSILTTSVECLAVDGVSMTYTPSLPSVGEWVTFSGSASVGSPPLTYTWDVDGVQIGNGPVITHAFPLAATAQTYTMTLTVANLCPSQREAQRVITVQPHASYLPVILREYPPAQ